MSAAGPFWTDERIQIVRDRWGALGESASAIAAALGGGCTRNSVISKAHRLGLSRKANRRIGLALATKPYRPPIAHERPVRAVAAPPRPAPPPRPPQPVPVRSTGPVHFLDARPNQCRYPLWSPSERTGLVCGEPVASPGCSWCRGCLRVVAVPRGERRAA